MGMFDKLFSKNQAQIKWFKIFDTFEDAQKNVLLNRGVTVLIEDKKICLVRNTKGFFAVSDACPHLGASLSKGVCNNFMEIVCPWHSYRFDLASGVENTLNHNLKVEVFPVKIDSAGLYIGISI